MAKECKTLSCCNPANASGLCPICELEAARREIEQGRLGLWTIDEFDPTDDVDQCADQDYLGNLNSRLETSKRAIDKARVSTRS